MLIAGTSYAGEIKKSIFSVLNYLLPLQRRAVDALLGQHRRGRRHGLFFGLSGTGKTTLSSDPDRGLIGDDEHGWSDRGVFNFEGGCYAKTIRLSAEAEPQIYATTRRFGTVLENVVHRSGDARSSTSTTTQFTENTRAAYPIEFIDNAVPVGQGGHPKNIVMLTADAFGVLPPIARLSPEARDVSLPLGLHRQGGRHREGRDRAEGHLQHLLRRAVPAARPEPSTPKMLGEKIAASRRRSVWLVNTGWTGGPYGVGSRMKIAYTRAMIRAALSAASSTT